MAAAGLLVWLFFRAQGAAAEPAGDHRGFVDRRHWQIVDIEGLALFGGLVLINGVLGQPKVAVAWVALVVGGALLPGWRGCGACRCTSGWAWC